MKISEIIDKYRPPKVLIFGRFGTGKTAYVLTHGPGTYVLDFDGGLRTAMTLKDQYTDHRLSCEVFDCVEKDFRYPSAFERGKAKILSIANTVRGGKTWEYDILVIDSFTEFADAAIRSVTGASGHAGKNPSQPEWGLIRRQMLN